MKTKLIIILIMVSASLFAQPVSGYLGKMFMTSLEMEILPGFQSYEANTSDFLNYLDEPRNYTPRFFLNTDYQFKRNRVVSGALGYARLQVPIYSYSTTGFSNTNYVRPMTSFMVQLRLKNGTKGANMPTSSTYFAYGIGLHFLRMPSAPVFDIDGPNPGVIIGATSLGAFNFALNAELGRRIVFKHGIVLDFGLVTNISSGLAKWLSFEETGNLVTEDYLKDQMVARAALNSFLNFKIGVGLFY